GRGAVGRGAGGLGTQARGRRTADRRGAARVLHRQARALQDPTVREDRGRFPDDRDREDPQGGDARGVHRRAGAGRMTGPAAAVRTTAPFRADHVGSLLRPPAVLAARGRRAAGDMSTEELGAVEDGAIGEVVAMQRDIGLRSATDGEFRRTAWHMDFIYRLGGIHPTDGKIQVKFHNADGDIEFTSAALAVDAPIRLTETIFG